ncbi:UDP-sugar:glycosyltransferase [Striga asiatica]|uniref:UDP-sugar:glycosyltransferase n=1 Tax=Striga asiatica TaxID=4170 RepID=A0A5A7RGK1_STRAF|nr:UDP-sugar:glycosyltransferase [Striga asiatica]
MENFELVFIPFPAPSHLSTTVEAAKLLLDRDPRLSITILVMKLPTDQTLDKFTQADPFPGLRFTHLPNQDFEPSPHRTKLFDLVNSRLPHVREAVSGLLNSRPGPSSRVAGLVLDMFTTVFVEAADELGLPSYIFFTSGASALGLFNYLVSLRFERGEDLTRYNKGSGLDLPVPCFPSPVPARVLPSVFVNEDESPIFLDLFKRVAGVRGVMVNTFEGLEQFALESLKTDGRTPRVYPVGPVMCGPSRAADGDVEVLEWLDGQPDGSVVFLCFGTMGSFGQAQVAEIAAGLERSGARFLWSLRKPGPGGPTEYGDFKEVLPEGFIGRTEGVGRVIGWAPQPEVLAHRAVGGFVLHCGWNSVLESVWEGVPMAAWPMYAEHQAIAFLLVRELGMAEEVRIDYQMDEEPPEMVVPAAEVEAAVRRLMAGGSGVREKVREMQGKSRAALEKGGSSYHALTSFIEDVVRNVG